MHLIEPSLLCNVSEKRSCRRADYDTIQNVGGSGAKIFCARNGWGRIPSPRGILGTMDGTKLWAKRERRADSDTLFWEVPFGVVHTSAPTWLRQNLRTRRVPDPAPSSVPPHGRASGVRCGTRTHLTW